METIEMFWEVYTGFWWLILLSSLIVGGAGSMREIGFLGGFIYSVVLTPLVGLIITMNSPETAKHLEFVELENAKKAKEKELLKPTTSKAEELERLVNLHEKGVLTAEEFGKLKSELLG